MQYFLCPITDQYLEVFASDGEAPFFTGLTLQSENFGWRFVFNPDYSEKFSVFRGMRASSLSNAVTVLRTTPLAGDRQR